MESNMPIEEYVLWRTAQNIQVNKARVLQNTVAQVVYEKAFGKELVANAFDAGATKCVISTKKTEDGMRIVFQDNGHGMSRKVLKDFFVAYRSTKDSLEQADQEKKSIGYFGAGKYTLCIPNLRGLEIITNTGREASRVMIPCHIFLMPPTPIEPLEPVMETGTTMIIHLSTDQLEDDFNYFLKSYIVDSCGFLKMEIIFNGVNVSKDFEVIGGGGLSKSYRITKEGFHYEITVGVESSYSQKLFCHRVFVCHEDLLKTQGYLALPNLSIRVNSDQFTLPISRNGIQNRIAVDVVKEALLTQVMPDFMEFLVNEYDHVDENSKRMIASLIIALEQRYMPFNAIHRSLKFIPFYCYGNLSINELDACDKTILICSKDSIGFDPEMARDLVLKSCPIEMIGFLQRRYGRHKVQRFENVNELISIDMDDRSEGDYDHLLNTHIRLLMEHFNSSDSVSSTITTERESFKDLTLIRSKISELEFKWARHKNRLSGAPSTDFKYKREGWVVYLNLNHPQMQNLRRLQNTHPELASHLLLHFTITTSNPIVDLTTDEQQRLLTVNWGLMAESAIDKVKPGERPIASTSFYPN